MVTPWATLSRAWSSGLIDNTIIYSGGQFKFRLFPISVVAVITWRFLRLFHQMSPVVPRFLHPHRRRHHRYCCSVAPMTSRRPEEPSTGTWRKLSTARANENEEIRNCGTTRRHLPDYWRSSKVYRLGSYGDRWPDVTSRPLSMTDWFHCSLYHFR